MAETEYVLVDTKLGQLRGRVLKSDFDNSIYHAFQGIPYAKPPVGDLRFKAPEPCEGWEGVRDALKDGNSSKQPILLRLPGMDKTATTFGDEDCLYLNVFVKQTQTKRRKHLPVLVSIHGGGFSLGSGGNESNMGGPDYFMAEDVVLVTINYRLGALGFLSLGTEVAPGNAGMKDQVMALRWVEGNIGSFGGDPNNVTIFGISAGGASVHYLLLSPMARGLFHKAIVQSGFATNPWALQTSPQDLARALAAALGCHSQDHKDIQSCLMTASADKITEASVKVVEEKKNTENVIFMFVPCVEVSGVTPFLKEHPLQVMKKGAINKVPVVIGACQREGTVVALLNGLSYDSKFSKLNASPCHLVPPFMNIKPGSEEEKEAMKAISDFYFDGKLLSWENVEQFLSYESDILFNFGFDQARDCLLGNSPSVFTYLFTNHSKCICGLLKAINPAADELTVKLITTSKETCHGADSSFLYMPGKVFRAEEETSADKEAVQRHIKAWTTFAATGDPNCKDLGVTWDCDSKSEPCYMDIGPQWQMRRGRLFAERMEFWRSLWSKYCA